VAKPEKRRKGRPRRPKRQRRRSGGLDRRSPVPLYFELGTALREILASEYWEPNSQFLTERQIAEEFGVSRSVIRPALRLLVSDGLIELRQGAGAFVLEPRRRLHPLGLVEALLEKPEGLTIKTTTARLEKAKKGVAAFLQLSPSSRVAHVTAVLRLEGEPVCVLDSYSPVGLVPWVLPTVERPDRDQKLSPRPELTLTKAEVRIELSFFSPWGGPQLDASPGDPALIGELTQMGRQSGRRKNDVPIEFTHLIFRPDRVQLEFSA
jgi:GntR family transcriptional regulator